MIFRDVIGWTWRFDDDIHTGRPQKRLVDGAAMGDFEDTRAMIAGQSRRQTESQRDGADTVRLLGHRPLGVERQAFGGKPVPGAEPGHEERHAPGEGPDEQFDRAHAGVRSPVLDRLIGDHRVTTGRDIEPALSPKGDV